MSEEQSIPLPRETEELVGHEAAERAMGEAVASGKIPHAWLITGPRGIGKATLAYRIAKARLAAEDGDGLFGAPEAPATLAVDPENPVARQIAAGAAPRLHAVRRAADPKTGRLYTQIRVDEVRRMKEFFQLSAADGGWRVAIIDPVDEMNAAAANALLKLLEEPPAKCLLLLVCHAPGRLLPTIRSRCRVLRLGALGADDLAAALAAAGVEADADPAALTLLSGGSAGEAARMASLGGVALYARLCRLFATAPGADRREMIAIADACGGREAEPVYDLTLRLIDMMLARLARAAAFGPPSTFGAKDEGALLARLSPPGSARRWADLAGEVQTKTARARAVNLDPAQVVLDTCLRIDVAARDARARAA